MARDYKDEYDKFQKDRTAYRAKLNSIIGIKVHTAIMTGWMHLITMVRFLVLKNLAKTKAGLRTVV